MKFRNYKNALDQIDRPFLITLCILIAIGLLMVFSASMYTSTLNGSSGSVQFVKQSSFAVIGLLIMFVLSRLDYKILKERWVAFTLLAISALLLILVLVPGIGVLSNNARRWLDIGPLTFQPSEIAKITGIIYISSLVSREPQLLRDPVLGNINTAFLWLKAYFPIGLLCGLTIIEPSMSAAIAIGVGMISALWYAGISKKQFLTFLIPIVIAGGLFLSVGWRWNRILAYIGRSNLTYQINQSLLAFGSGGLIGVGLGNGKQKLLFLPEIQNDFIFANIGEEFGLLGCLAVLSLYAFLIYRGFRIGLACKDKFGRLYTLSTMTLLGFQIFVNVGVATSIYPVTGMALPFISYGGTSLIILLATMGPILNISRQLKQQDKQKEKSKTNENSSSSRRDRRTYLPGHSHSG